MSSRFMQRSSLGVDTGTRALRGGIVLLLHFGRLLGSRANKKGAASARSSRVVTPSSGLHGRRRPRIVRAIYRKACAIAGNADNRLIWLTVERETR
jgi:hypothetical protein